MKYIKVTAVFGRGDSDSSSVLCAVEDDKVQETIERFSEADAEHGFGAKYPDADYRPLEYEVLDSITDTPEDIIEGFIKADGAHVKLKSYTTTEV